MKLLPFFLFFVCALFSDQILVTLHCSNGSNCPNVRIEVYDSLGAQVPNLTATDEKGQFVIENSETFVEPFSFFYRGRNGSTCGGERIFVDASGNGYVYLNYYPTELPCSCGNL